MVDYRVIVVDNERSVCESIVEFINSHIEGFTVVGCFGDGREAIEFINTNPVEVVINAIKIPEASGIEIAKYIYENKLKIEVIIVSAYRYFEYARQALEYGVISYLLKPISSYELERAMCKIKTKIDEKRLLYACEQQWQAIPKLTSNDVSIQRDELIMQKAIKYIKENYMRAITLREVADSVYLSEFYFSKFFKKNMKKSFTDYIIELRIEKAKELIRTGNYSLCKISSLVGYDRNYFSKVFKNYTGCSPSEYCLRMGSKDE